MKKKDDNKKVLQEGYGLYIHIPYCRSRCRYCDFYTSGGHAGVPQEYVAALIRNFLRYAPQDEEGRSYRPQTVYFGGGTPGLLQAGQVEQLLQVVRPLPGAEVTLEANPESTKADVLGGWKSAGINRLSLGVQSAFDASLRRLGRVHTAQQAKEALAAAQKAGFTNVSMDMMLALPQYTRTELEETVKMAQAGGAAHVSAYLLKIEPDTPFGQNLPAGLPGEDEAARFYLQGVETLEKAGYAQYEISNFAQPGFAGRHNLLYWDAGPWLGLGPAAHSHLLGRRFSFAPRLASFLQDELPPMEEGILDAEDYMMLRLRLRKGLVESDLKERFGMQLTQKQRTLISVLCEKGYAITHTDGFALSPEGMLVQNSILTRFFS